MNSFSVLPCPHNFRASFWEPGLIRAVRTPLGFQSSDSGRNNKFFPQQPYSLVSKFCVMYSHQNSQLHQWGLVTELTNLNNYVQETSCIVRQRNTSNKCCCSCSYLKHLMCDEKHCTEHSVGIIVPFCSSCSDFCLLPCLCAQASGEKKEALSCGHLGLWSACWCL